MRYGFGNSFDRVLPKLGDKSFSPLDYSPTFWFDYNQYSTGVLGSEVDRTGNYTTTPFNSVEISSDGTNNALSTNGSNLYAVSYGDTFEAQLKYAHSHLLIVKPKVVSVPFAVFCGVDDGFDNQYSVLQVGQKLRLYIKINGVNNIFETANNVITTTDYMIVIIKVQQSGVTMEINGVNQPLSNSSFTSTLSDLTITGKEFYVGARNNDGTIDLPSNCYIGDHLIYPFILTNSQTTEILNYFV